jgi:hypothetical protein
VTPEEFTAFRESASPADRDDNLDDHNRWVSSRILDQYVVAGLWQLFGIRWDVVFLFGVAMSTLTCLFICLIGRRLGGSFWSGLAAGALYSAAPLASYLETWSLRDSSPLWFAAAGFWLLFCRVDRTPAPGFKRQMAECSGLGLVVMLGFGWRPDVLLTVAFLGTSLIVLLALQKTNWRRIAACAAAYAAGAWLCHAAIEMLTNEPAVDSQNGFHMAAYADFSRANLLKLENSFQIHRCDRETLFVARQYEHAHEPLAPPLPFIGSRYSAVCRQMFFDELRYNAFWWTFKFPVVYWKSLNGLVVPGAFETLDLDQLKQSRSPEPQAIYREVLDPLSDCLPWLFLVGVLVATTTGAAKAQSALLAVFSVAQTFVLLLVLPEQKHLATMQLPLCVFDGIGLFAIAQLFRPTTWRRLPQLMAWRPPAAWSAFVVGGLACWVAACGAAYLLSVHERQVLIADIKAAARDATPAPDTLRGDRVFSVRVLPGELADPTGYLLKIAAGREAGSLLCRHIHYPQDWCWPRVLETTHRLHPNREQFFFVTCFQGSEFGDPRPYSCSMTVGGDARIVSCERVNLKNWQHLQVSTLFDDDDASPGSPRATAENSVMRWPNWPAIRLSADDSATLKQLARQTLYTAPPAPATPSQPLDHLIGRDKQTGVWRIAISDGRRFQPANLNYWSPREWSSLVTGDFNGDGLTDLLGRSADGQWWLALPNGNCAEFKPCHLGLPNFKQDYIGVGDFNGDGIDDVAIRSADDDQWWIGLSDGRRIEFRRWGPATHGAPPENVRIADFNGDGRADIAEFNPKSGEWIVSLSDGTRFAACRWGTWDSAVAWQHLVAADFDRDGKSDVAGFNPANGEWQIGLSDGRALKSQSTGVWPADAEWKYVTTVRTSSGAHRGIVALDAKSHRIAIAEFDGRKLTTRFLPAHPALESQFFVGRFAGDAADNLVGMSTNGELWIGRLTPDSITYQRWGRWQESKSLTDFHVVSFWR